MYELGNGSLVNGVPFIPEVKLELTHQNAVVPTYANDGDSGMDVYATEELIIAPGETKLCKLGFKMEIPKHPYHDQGYRWEVQARPRSGVSLKTHLRVANAPGTIDNGYRGEVGIILTNTGTEAVFVNSMCNIETQEGFMAYNLKGEQENVGFGFTPVPEYSIIVHKGDRVAQLVFNEVIRPMKFTITSEVNKTDRGEGGFGSTGV